MIRNRDIRETRQCLVLPLVFRRNAQPHEVSSSKGLGVSQQVAYEVRMDAHTLLANFEGAQDSEHKNSDIRLAFHYVLRIIDCNVL